MARDHVKDKDSAVISIMTAFFLSVAVFPWSFHYYFFLKLFVFTTSVILFKRLKHLHFEPLKKTQLISARVLLVFMAVIYQPLTSFPFNIERKIWVIADILSTLFFINLAILLVERANSQWFRNFVYFGLVPLVYLGILSISTGSTSSDSLMVGFENHLNYLLYVLRFVVLIAFCCGSYLTGRYVSRLAHKKIVDELSLDRQMTMGAKFLGIATFVILITILINGINSTFDISIYDQTIGSFVEK